MTTGRRVVSDTGPLITLEKLPEGYRLIRQLYREILISRSYESGWGERSALPSR